MLPVDMNINFNLAQFEQRSKKPGDLCFLFSSWRKMQLLEEKVPAAHVFFESLIVGRNFILLLSVTLHSYNSK